MVPDRFEFFDALPKTSTDKAERRALVELATQRAEEQSGDDATVRAARVRAARTVRPD